MRGGAVYSHGCGRRPPEGASREFWLVCEACLPDFEPSCALCGARISVAHVEGGFRAYRSGKLCGGCMGRVQGAGPWKERRARANAARAEALCERFPGLTFVLRSRTFHTTGEVGGRPVHVRLREAPREGSFERYIFHVGLGGSAGVTIEDLGLEPRLRGAIVEGSFKVTQERTRWLRVAFRHLGRRDTVAVLEALLAAAARA